MCCVLIVCLCCVLFVVYLSLPPHFSIIIHTETHARRRARAHVFSSTYSNWSLTLFADPLTDAHELMVYLLLRREFLFGTGPVPANSMEDVLAAERSGNKHKLKRDFDFSAYLASIMGEQLGRTVNIHWYVRLCVCVCRGE